MRRPLVLVGAALTAALIGAVVVAHPGLGKPQQLPLEPVAIEVSARPINAFDPRQPAKARFGALEFRGGVELQSNAAVFGGLSGLALDAAGERLLAISDGGLWLSGRLVYHDGKLAGVAEARMAALRGPNGAALVATGEGDAESLARAGEACVVGIERRNEIRRFACAGDPLLAPGTLLPVPAALKKLPHNRGLEALAAVPAGVPNGGALIGISERGESATADAIGFILGGPRPGQFRWTRSEEFDVTDAVVVGASLLVLERHYSPLRGVAMRLRRARLADIAPGASVDGEVLMVADRAYQIDNMEGLAAHANAAGETILTLVSDDNYSLFQRTLVLQFKLVE